MNPSLTNCLLRSALTARKDLFGENCTFVSFEEDDPDENPKWKTEFGYHHQPQQSTSIKFGRIIYHRDEKVERSNHLVLKNSPTQCPTTNDEFSAPHFFNEVLFYTKILPFFRTITNNTRIGELFPEYYNSLLQYNISLTDEGVILFENVQASGYSQKSSPFSDYDHLSLAMRKLGEFHAHSYRLRDTFPDRFHAYTRCRVKTNVVLSKQLPSRLSGGPMRGFEPLQPVDSDYGSKIEDVSVNCDEMFRNTLTADEATDKKDVRNDIHHVVCHGNFCMNNILFRYDENGKPTDLKMVDLTSWRCGSPVIDLAYMLYLNADQQMRNDHRDDLIDEYYTAVKNTFPTTTNVPSKDSILKELNTNVMYAYFMTLCFFFLIR